MDMHDRWAQNVGESKEKIPDNFVCAKQLLRHELTGINKVMVPISGIMKLRFNLRLSLPRPGVENSFFLHLFSCYGGSECYCCLLLLHLGNG